MARFSLVVALALLSMMDLAVAIRPDQSAVELQAASSCGDLKAPQDCNADSDCTWCIGKGDIGTSCYAVHMARMLPKRFFTCDNDPRGIAATATATTAAGTVQGVSECVGQANATACDELNSCTWCVGQGNVGTACYPVAMARALPKRYFMCDNDSRSVVAQLALRKQEEQEEQEVLKGVSECVHVEDANGCDAKPGCTWCVGQGNVGTDCYPVGAARMLPKRFFTCDNDSRS